MFVVFLFSQSVYSTQLCVHTEQWIHNFGLTPVLAQRLAVWSIPNYKKKKKTPPGGLIFGSHGRPRYTRFCVITRLLRAPRFSPSLPLLKQLHWLPVNYRIKFKLSTLTYRALAIHQPPYLASLLHFSNVPRQLRSSTSQQLSIPRTKLNLGKRAFSVAAPIIWNELPTTLKSCESLASFRKNLKTYLFKIAFPP